MLPPYDNPQKLARAALRMITQRLRGGWYPRAYVCDIGDTWIVGVNLYNDQPVRERDLRTYEFEFRCTSEDVARAGVRALHDLLFPKM